MMRSLREKSRVKKVHPTEATIDLDEEIIIGDFIDIQKPTYNQIIEELEKKVGANL
jgi:hypothetical protein